MERERERKRETHEPAVFMHTMLGPYHPACTCVTHRRERSRERDKSVGGSVANHFLPGRVRSSNNRILVRAASGKGCTPLYVRLERTATKKKKKERGSREKEKKKKEGREPKSCSMLE